MSIVLEITDGQELIRGTVEDAWRQVSKNRKQGKV